MQKFKKHIAAFLLLAIALFITPHELMHSLVDHSDDSDVCTTQTEGNTLSSLHQHCDILQLASPPLYLSIHNFSFAFTNLASTLIFSETDHYHFSNSAILFLRGPPALV